MARCRRTSDHIRLTVRVVGLTIGAVASAAAIHGASLAASGQSVASQPAQTHAQTKIDTRLRSAIERLRSKETGVEARPRAGALNLDDSGRPLVDIDARVSPELRRAIEEAGGLVISEFAEYNAIRARLPLAQIEKLADRDDVKFVRTADQAMTAPSSGGVR